MIVSIRTTLVPRLDCVAWHRPRSDGAQRGTSSPWPKRAPPRPGADRRGGTKKPITVDAIIETAFGIVEREGYDALTMRRVASALETGPASLYAHVVNKEDLDDLLIGRLCAEIELPEPDPAHLA